MPDTTENHAIPFPIGTDSADGPGAFQALAERVDEIVQEIVAGQNLAIVAVGDFKDSARTTSHDRWLLCDIDRELTQAEIETELGLDAGGALEFVTLLGTGAASIHGVAATGKVFIPGFREKMPMAPGPSHPKKGTGSSGGAESHSHGPGSLTIPQHSHSFFLPVHTHGFTTGGRNPTSGVTVNEGAGQTALQHTHSGTTQNSSAGVNGTTGSSGAASQTVSGDTSAQSNMPPYRVKGHVFLRV